MLVAWIRGASPAVFAPLRKVGIAMSPCTSCVSHAVPPFSPAERIALARLHARYQQSADLLTERELAQLDFLRWLAGTGRFVDDGGPAAARAAASDR